MNDFNKEDMLTIPSSVIRAYKERISFLDNRVKLGDKCIEELREENKELREMVEDYEGISDRYDNYNMKVEMNIEEFIDTVENDIFKYNIEMITAEEVVNRLKDNLYTLYSIQNIDI